MGGVVDCIQPHRCEVGIMAEWSIGIMFELNVGFMEELSGVSE